MMFLLEEIGVEAAMIIATVTAAGVFVWAVGTMLVRWVGFARSERLATDNRAPEHVGSAIGPSRIAGPSL